MNSIQLEYLRIRGLMVNGSLIMKLQNVLQNLKIKQGEMMCTSSSVLFKNALKKCFFFCLHIDSLCHSWEIKKWSKDKTISKKREVKPFFFFYEMTNVQSGVVFFEQTTKRNPVVRAQASAEMAPARRPADCSDSAHQR
jgi:hypothetical protein